MREVNNMLQAAARLHEDGAEGALATVVHVEGSSYRTEGARMLIRADGTYVGTISAGCLEGEVVQHALRVMETGTPEMLTLEQPEGEDPLGFGSGCGGTVHLLLEPLQSADATPDALDLIRHCVEHRRSGALATVMRADGGLAAAQGQHLLVTEADPAVHGRVDPAGLHAALADDAAAALSAGRARQTTYTLPAGQVQVLIEVIRPPLRLLLFGEEQDVGPLVRQAHLLGWEPVVIGRSPQPDLERRFPGAAACLRQPDLEQLPAGLRVGPRDAGVVMSHNYLRDRALLRLLLPSEAGYVGALGARSRLEDIVGDFAAGEAAADQEAHQAVLEGRLSGPVGLDIGAQTPEEIALSIAAEVQAVFAGCDGGRLSSGTGRIHPPRARPHVVASAVLSE